MSHADENAPNRTDAIFRSFDEPLRGFVSKRVANASDVDDLVQEIYLRIAEKRDALDEIEHVSGWLHRVARNAIIDHYRARGRAAVLVADVPEIPGADAHGEASSTENRSELSGCMAPMIDRLAEPYREALRLTDLEGLTQAEAAKQVGISLSGMKSRVQRGREQLRERVLDCCEIELDRRRGINSFESKVAECACRSSSPQIRKPQT